MIIKIDRLIHDFSLPNILNNKTLVVLIVLKKRFIICFSLYNLHITGVYDTIWPFLSQILY